MPMGTQGVGVCDRVLSIQPKLITWVLPVSTCLLDLDIALN